MDALIIKATEFTPEVTLDPGSNRFEISGESRPENAGKFYHPILEWLDKYHSLRYWQDNKFKNKVNNPVFEFKLEYFNSTSAKFILDILKKFEFFIKDDLMFSVNWYYEDQDLDMKESGEEFAKMTEANFNIVQI
jgi:hypothetical protein